MLLLWCVCVLLIRLLDNGFRAVTGITISGPKQTFPRKPRSILLPLIILLHCEVRMGILYGATRWLYRVQALRLRLPNQLPAQSFVMAVVSQPEFYRRLVQQV